VVRIRRSLSSAGVLALAFAVAPSIAGAQALTQPPSGDNQRCSVTQGIGVVTVRVDYSSPDVHGPDGADRKGHIWGELVPYGMHDLGFNDCKSCPWRAGANENTVFTTSHDVQIEGQPLPAGSYGLHMIADPSEWTIIFSKNSTSWGSFWYRPEEDQLRVKVTAIPGEYHEWLTYEFTDRKPAAATVALQWENLQVPIRIAVPNMTDLYVAQMRNELRNSQSFTWVNWNTAAQYCLNEKTNLVEAEAWAKHAVEDPFSGNANLTTLGTMAQIQLANDRDADATKTIDRALAMGGDNPIPIHQLARQLQAQGENEQAMRVFQANAKRFPGRWPTTLGLARGYAALGDTKAALAQAKKAVPQAPDEPNRKNVERFVQQLEAKLAGGGTK